MPAVVFRESAKTSIKRPDDDGTRAALGRQTFEARNAVGCGVTLHFFYLRLGWLFLFEQSVE
jgi:hypothetical protein